jgi:site-specific DNA-methyltransferase (adenine-specific)/site-specific DNA-methyltransferase (cytosine-N4-specific)
MNKEELPSHVNNSGVATETTTAYTPALFDLRPPNSRIILGDVRDVLPELEDARFRCCITSPPYWGLRDYGVENQIGAEEHLDEYIASLTDVFRKVRRVLADDGTLWLNIGDSYTSGNRKWRAVDKKNPARAMHYRPPTPQGLKSKDLIGIPWRVALALQEDGWYLRSDIIWHKPNCQPESVKDRPTSAHEYVFLFSKSERYFYDYRAVKEPGKNPGTLRNRRTVWSIPTEPFPGAHFATFPPGLVEPCIMAGSERGDEVLDPFFGSGTVGLVCMQHQRDFTGIEIKPEYVEIAEKRLGRVVVSESFSDFDVSIL